MSTFDKDVPPELMEALRCSRPPCLRYDTYAHCICTVEVHSGYAYRMAYLMCVLGMHGGFGGRAKGEESPGTSTRWGDVRVLIDKYKQNPFVFSSSIGCTLVLKKVCRSRVTRFSAMLWIISFSTTILNPNSSRLSDPKHSSVHLGQLFENL